MGMNVIAGDSLVSFRVENALSPGKIVDPIGYIPEIDQTYSYYTATYGLQNEVGLGIAESTCSSKLLGKQRQPGSTNGGLFWVGELTRIALERCATAICAVELIGSLAETHGFYRLGEINRSRSNNQGNFMSSQ